VKPMAPAAYAQAMNLFRLVMTLFRRIWIDRCFIAPSNHTLRDH
jgi:hypothetical protein